MKPWQRQQQPINVGKKKLFDTIFEIEISGDLRKAIPNKTKMAMSNGVIGNGNKLMQEIYDQFLVCKICYEPYKQPKTLACLHTFCCVCLEKHQDAEMERSYR